MANTDDRIYIDDLAKRLKRAPHTIRQWLHRSDFPKSLKPKEEGGRHKLYWTPSQMSGLKLYAKQRERSRGTFGRV
jgi:hypothetical protein